MRKVPSVGVVILTWNDGDVLAKSVESALASFDVEVDVVVVDNGSAPPAVVTSDPRVRLVRNPVNVGVAPGRNQGAAHLASPWLCVLDSDARLQPDALSTLVRSMESRPDVGIAGPVFVNQQPEESAGRAPSPLRKVARGLGIVSTYASVPNDPAGVRSVDFVIGACQVMRRSVFEKLGGYDEGIFYGPEDVDLCLRAQREGWSVIQVSGARCHHPPRRRHRRIWTRAGLRHAWALVRHYKRHGGR